MATPLPKAKQAKIKALVDQGLSYRQVAAKTGTTSSTVCRVLQRLGTTEQQVEDFLEVKGKAFLATAGKAIELAHRVMDNLSTEDLAAISVPQKTGLLMACSTLSGTMYDKYRLESGQSTSNVASLLLGAQWSRADQGRDGCLTGDTTK